MKDEEMAEEYLQGIEGDDCVIITDREERKQAFLAGLKAGRPQWHKVADGDLPEYRYYVLVSRGTRTDKALYNKYEGKWYGYYDDDELDDVIAWCEIPTFDKK